ncbi:sugar ABC transporter ATP-binding protein [Virgibacillus sp. AGTR]|uniref:sugar ABC transporter ATP-binding protein n=1 Tax=Virgibacillus TaxID=84406 RepID=UPI0019644B5E|nr:MULTISPECIES: sugar ABC transporter ATP-binding protein [unclassified Virgibacillus]MCC2250916.1 sugar ABC transporter ATP-binding protein [Virgibacillus sp. AGTR]MDY7044760.1 sugar ABC transporter ATP-binding protein [Virgibacillus sp. M23]QRZ16366.1 sugar ABC transporter ATP-binding protein [Virgibacillus sp. AGTR]
MKASPIIEMANIDKYFAGNPVLKAVDFQVLPGEIHALMGENGAGKSTLVKILTGIYRRDQGVIKWKNKEVVFKNPKQAEQNGIIVIHQELNIIPHLTVSQNLFLGKDITYGKTGILNKKEMHQRTKRRLYELGVTNIHPNDIAGNLSIGKQQLVEIARALAANAEMIIMDEPTAALTEREIERLFHVIQKLKNQGVSIIYISHRMEEIFDICDRITVLRDGQTIGTKLIADTSFTDIVRMMVGRELGDRFPERVNVPGKVIFEVENISKEDLFENISFSVRKGEILGIAGLMGAGRSEVMEAIFGFSNKDHGAIRINGKLVTIKHPRDAIEAGIGFITEDRKSKGLIMHAPIRENIASANLKAISTYGVIVNSKETLLIEALINRLQIRAISSEQEAKSLSGGNQQKVVLAKWLGINPKILILDEPTRGVDIGAKKEIYKIINELTKSGVAIIMISSELPEILGMSDRIMVMHEGKIATFLDRQEANQERIMAAATGGVRHDSTY